MWEHKQMAPNDPRQTFKNISLCEKCGSECKEDESICDKCRYRIEATGVDINWVRKVPLCTKCGLPGEVMDDNFWVCQDHGIIKTIRHYTPISDWEDNMIKAFKSLYHMDKWGDVYKIMGSFNNNSWLYTIRYEGTSWCEETSVRHILEDTPVDCNGTPITEYKKVNIDDKFKICDVCKRIITHMAQNDNPEEKDGYMLSKNTYVHIGCYKYRLNGGG